MPKGRALRGWSFTKQAPNFWQDTHAIRADLFGTERLENHAVSLATEHRVVMARGSGRRLSLRLKENAAALLAAYQASAASLKDGQAITPAAEWLLDNFHTVDAQLRQIKADLPADYYHQLPKLASGPFAGYPRVLELAWAYVAHTDSLFSATVLTRFVQAYQTVQPLLIGELWAIAITLRIVMIENMRRLSAQIVAAQRVRLMADQAVDRALSGEDGGRGQIETLVAGLSDTDGPDIFCAQVAKRLRGADPSETPLLGWLQDRLHKADSSLETLLMTAQHRQGATNITMRNLVNSMRMISELDWADFFEAVSLVDARLRASFDFQAMDFPTRNDYRTAIETLARGAGRTEAEVTEAALDLATQGDPGAALLGDQRRRLERALVFAVPLGLSLQRWVWRTGLPGYAFAILLASLAVLTLALAFTGVTGWAIGALAITGSGVAIEAGMALVNLAVTRCFAPRQLPGMELLAGIPPEFRVLVAVPVLLSSAADLQEHIERLEVHYLSSTGGAVSFALVSDGLDAATETTPQDADLLALAQSEIARLNARYQCEDGPRFLLLHRHRLWNPQEAVWMGWERKRGKLYELNRLLRGAADTSFTCDSVAIRQDIRFVITLDADTRLLRDTVRRMVGKMAHPLNHAQFDTETQRVTKGYGILQPRVAPSLPMTLNSSFYQRVYSSPGGIEPYAAASSNVYQELFDEGSFTGKGIYDVDAFMAALAGRVPDNSMLSHDLFEGVFARAGLASDVQVVEDFPARQEVDAARQHRWARGDWQLLPWITGCRQTAGGITAVGRWKMLDNLRRSLMAPMALMTLAVGWMLPQAAAWTAAVLVMLALPYLIALPFAVLPGRAGITSRSHFEALWSDARMAGARIGLNIILLADTAWSMLDAIARSLNRLRTRRHLLEWITAAQEGSRAVPSYWRQYLRHAGGIGLCLGVCALAYAIRPQSLPVLLPFAAVWLAAPAIARLISLPRTVRNQVPLTQADRLTLRHIARQTWRYFETFVSATENFLPPDNFQETPNPVIAHRTSPTNIGLYLLSVTAAHDMGWISQAEAATRLERTLTTMQRMPRFRGHLHNWHDTRDLRVLEPAYVSSVDSGNLAGHLIAVAQACEAWITTPASNPEGLQDARALAQTALRDGAAPDLSAVLDQIAQGASDELIEKARLLARSLPDDSDAAFWTLSMNASTTPALAPQGQLRLIADMARSFAIDMDFTFLVHPEKKLLSIGFTVPTNTLDPNCYDLLASEARLASLFAIAKGDVETRHWFRLGRAATPIGAGSALISWSGSMFEYLMPALVMRAPEGSLLEQTSHRVVQRQRSYAGGLNLPWGISESAYNARDLEMTYQYSNFGVPGLGLKRGLADDRVIAPYATGLAAMVDPAAAVQNFCALTALGAQGRYGFYEALDFTASRLPAGPHPTGQPCAQVRSFMAHHQGMTITALANVLQNGQLRARFHAEPMIQAVELLLQERVPRDASVAAPHATDVQVSPAEYSASTSLRRFENPAGVWPTAHVLSNGRYSVTLAPTGAGFSKWQELAITRWRHDPTQAGYGTYLYLRDLKSGAQWSGAVHPLGLNHGHSAVFCDHNAAFTHQAPHLITHTEVVVSGEDDAEARRVTLTNTGRHVREVAVTSYAELVLAPPKVDLSHPAFSKLFVVTDFLPELGVLIATRRRRAPSDPEVWAAHVAVVEGAETAPLQHESDRARFIGRGQSAETAAMADAPLSGTVGTVLDPIFSLRRSLRIPAGGRARVTFWTMVAPTSDMLLNMVDRHRDASAFGRAATLSWTQSQVQLRHHGIAPADAADFQRLAGMLLRHDARLRASPARIIAGHGPQSRLWGLAISGDLPIVLFIITDAEDIARLREVLAAQDYLRMRQVAVDLVILNDRASSYVQDLQLAIETAVRSALARPRPPGQGNSQSAIHTLRSDLIQPEARAMLVASADVILYANRGSIGSQLDSLPANSMSASRPRRVPLVLSTLDLQAPAIALPAREFVNGLGGFADGGREYVTLLENGKTTPAPWINVIANPSFGFSVSTEGSGAVWAENSRENLLTPWSNDPVTDPAGEAIYLKELDTGLIWTPTALPIRSGGQYLCRHGFGYSAFEHTAHGIGSELVQFVALDVPIKITRLQLSNLSSRTRRLSVTGYAEWVLGTSRAATAGKIVTRIDAETGAILAHNPRAMAFAGRIAFAYFGAGVSSLTCDRTEFLGCNGKMRAPAALTNDALSGLHGPALDACAALQHRIALAPGETIDLTFLLGQADTAEAAVALIQTTRARPVDAMLAEVKQHWTDLLTEVQVCSPDRSFDIMLNGWLLYQTLSCRIWARAGFYQASGAFGFRDQLQDGMALTALRPDLTRAHLLRAAARQFPEGDVQHWWLPHSGQGVRTRISDDRVWLAYAAANYAEVSGDLAVFDEPVQFLEGPALLPGAHDDFFQPQVSDNSTSLFDHCARALDQTIGLTGANGMPLIGTGDWNDGMNRVGEAGQGTSVWLGWLLITTLRAMVPHAQTRDPARAICWQAHADSVAKAIEQNGWDGAWYRRGTYDDGTLLGSASSQECQIDSIAQSWAVLSGAADPARAVQAMASLTSRLVRADSGLALLFTPPFDQTPNDPGYIKGYPPGLRENGGQYSHAAMWAILAKTRLGDGNGAHALFALVNPINHALTPEAAQRYKVEPYVIAADVYSTAPHEGRGGWTWYTGSAGWMYRAGIEGILGLTRSGTALTLSPCLPADWPELTASIGHGKDRCDITILNNNGTGCGIAKAALNGITLPVVGGKVTLQRSIAKGRLAISLR